MSAYVCQCDYRTDNADDMVEHLVQEHGIEQERAMTLILGAMGRMAHIT